MSNLIAQVYRLNAADQPQECDTCERDGVWAIASEDRKGQRYVLFSCAYDLASILAAQAALQLGPALFKPEL
jgi:hypothetical protein